MIARSLYEVSLNGDSITVAMPPGHNRWIIGLGFGVGAPWLLTFLVGSVAVAILAQGEIRRTALLGVVAGNLLFLIGHIAAAAGVWLAAYQTWGSETLEIGPSGFVVRRRGMGIDIPIKLPRSSGEQIVLLDAGMYPGRGPHPRLEIRSEGSAMRFGAGLSGEQALAVREAAEAALGAASAE